jgi:hypothetical protein
MAIGDQCGFCGSREFILLEPEEVEAKTKTKVTTIKAGFLFKEGGGFKSWYI